MNGESPSIVLGYDHAAAVVQREAERARAGAATARRVEWVPLAVAAGRVLAEAVAADRDQPPFARATRDGFACRAADLRGGGLRVVGQLRAGEAWTLGALRPGEAAEIMTGRDGAARRGLRGDGGARTRLRAGWCTSGKRGRSCRERTSCRRERKRGREM